MASITSPRLNNTIRTDIPAINAILKALAKADPSILSDIENGTKRFYEGTSGWEFQELKNGAWITHTKFNIDAQSVDGFNTSVDAVASTIVVRGTDGKLKGNLTGKADTAGTADKLASTLLVNAGGTGATSMADARTNLGVPPINHKSTTTIYGVSSATEYGHNKLSDATDSNLGADSGTAATPKALKTAKAEAITAAATQASSALEAFAEGQAAKDAAQDKAVAGKLDKSGGTMTGSIVSTAVEPFTSEKSGGDFVAVAKNPDKNDAVYFGIGTQGTRRGIWDKRTNRWVVYFEEDEGILRAWDGKVITESGGTLNGDLRSAAGTGRYCKTHTTGSMVISGGTGVHDGASIHLFGKDSTDTNKGNAFFSSMNADGTRHYVCYTTAGHLTDDWNTVLSYGKTIRFLESANNTITLPAGGTWDVWIYEQNADGDYGGANIHRNKAGGSTITTYHPYTRAMAVKKAW